MEAGPLPAWPTFDPRRARLCRWCLLQDRVSGVAAAAASAVGPSRSSSSSESSPAAPPSYPPPHPPTLLFFPIADIQLKAALAPSAGALTSRRLLSHGRPGGGRPPPSPPPPFVSAPVVPPPPRRSGNNRLLHHFLKRAVVRGPPWPRSKVWGGGDGGGRAAMRSGDIRGRVAAVAAGRGCQSKEEEDAGKRRPRSRRGRAKVAPFDLYRRRVGPGPQRYRSPHPLIAG